MSTEDISIKVEAYENMCNTLFKEAIIKKMPNDKYRVVSEKGKNLGEYSSKLKAKKRLQQVEFFKHKDQNNSSDSIIDLSDVDDWSYSAIIRKLKQIASDEEVNCFLKIYKNNFDKAVKKEIHNPDRIALQNAILAFSKQFKIKLPKVVKNAAITELGDPVIVGKYLSDIVKFILTRISPEKRPHTIQNLRKKIYYLNERELSDKKMPASSSIGQSITFIKTVLFNHDANYIRQVLNSVVQNL